MSRIRVGVRGEGMAGKRTTLTDTESKLQYFETMKKFIAMLAGLALMITAFDAQAGPGDKGEKKGRKGAKGEKKELRDKQLDNLFNRLDKNQNGVLDPSEKEALQKAFGKRPALKALDKNGNGKLEETEIAAIKPSKQGEPEKKSDQ